jgi:D-arabinose 1-dehydrogenase-like Zn-dependent alcohol dehydrogenase
MSQEITCVDPETGEILKVDLSHASVPRQADLREAMPLLDQKGVFAIVGAKFAHGVTFDDEYALVLIVNSEKKLIMTKTASSEVIASIRRMLANGLCTPASPAIVKVGSAKTSSGFTVNKLQLPSPDEVKAFLSA